MGFPVEIDILANIDKALSNISQFTKKASSQVESLASSFGAVGKAAAAIAVAGFAFDRLIGEALEADKSIKQLTNGLRLTGEATQENVDGFNAFAESLAETTAFTDDAIRSQIGFLKSLGATNDETQNIIKSATDLAAITGDSLEGAIRKLTASYAGNTKGLATIIPELKNFTKEQLAAGAAVDLVGQKFAGSALKGVSGLSGSVGQLKKSFGELIEATGTALFNNRLFISSVELLTKLLKFLEKAVFAFGESIAFLGNTVALSFGKIAQTLSKFAGFKGFEKFFGEFNETTNKKIKESSQNLTDLFNGVDKSSKISSKGVSKLSNQLKETGDEAKKAKEQILKELVSDPIGAILKFKIDFSKAENLGALGEGLLKGIKEGAKGAEKLMTGAVKAGVDLLIPGLGGFAGELFSLLSQGPEAVKQFITEFLNGIPVIIENVISALPAIFEALNEQLPIVAVKLIDSIITNLPKLIGAAIQSLAGQMGFVAVRFAVELIKNIPTIISEFVKEIGKQISSLGGLFGGGGGGVFGGGGFLGLGFADGGIVPGGAPFTDRVPAMLTPGERVIPRDEVNREQSQPQILTVNLVVGEEQLASVLLNLNRQGFRVA